MVVGRDFPDLYYFAASEQPAAAESLSKNTLLYSHLLHSLGCFLQPNTCHATGHKAGEKGNRGFQYLLAKEEARCVCGVSIALVLSNKQKGLEKSIRVKKQNKKQQHKLM